MMLVTIAPTLVSLCTFTALALSGGALHASTVFSSIALFNALRAPLSALPDLFASLAHARVALSRLQAVLRAEEEADGAEEEDVDGEGGAPYEPPTVPGADVLRASGAIFSWAPPPPPPPPPPMGAAARATRRRAGAAAYRALPADAEPVCWTGIDARSGESVGDAPSEPAESAAAVEAEVRLGGVSVGVRRGELLVIVGATASGKSTLCCGLLGELHERGDLDGFELERPRRVAYCGQHAWLRRSSLRQNIVFGLPFDQSRYDAALAACGLLADVRSLPLGDAAELGERGVTISGGQQARVALARAVYAKPQLALLDEPLAALDPALREYVWHHALRGALSDAAVVLSTSDPQLALLADKVLVLHAGRAVQCAPPAALAATPGAFADLIADSLRRRAAVHGDVAGGAPRRLAARAGAQLLAAGVARCLVARGGGDADAAAAARLELEPLAPCRAISPRLVRSARRRLERWRESAAAEPGAALPHRGGRGRGASSASASPEGGSARQVGGEGDGGGRGGGGVAGGGRRERGGTRRLPSVRAALGGGGGAVFGGALRAFAAAQASLVATDCWLARWSSLPAPQQEDVALNLGVLAALAALAALLVGVQAAAWPLLCLRASATMHAEAVRAVLRAPMAYHTATPSGRLVARFSKDVDALDASLPSMLAQAFTCAAALLASLATIVASAPLVAPAVAVAALALIRIVAKYRPTAGEAKRLVSVLHGPIVAPPRGPRRPRVPARVLPAARRRRRGRRALEASARARRSTSRCSAGSRFGSRRSAPRSCSASRLLCVGARGACRSASRASRSRTR